MRYRNLIGRLSVLGLLMATTGLAATDLPPEFKRQEGTTSISKMTLEKVWTSPKREIRIGVGNEPETISYRLPELKNNEDKIAVLKFRVRLSSEEWEKKNIDAGWNTLLKIVVNGKPLNIRTAEGTRRVLNHKEDFIRSTNPTYPTSPLFGNVPTVGGPGIHVFFSGKWDRLNPVITSDREEMYWYVLDISDVAVAGRENHLELINLATTQYYMSNQYLLIDGLEVGYFDRTVFDRLMETPSATLGEFKTAVTFKKGDIVLNIAPQGGIRIDFRGDRYYWKSYFSEPGEKIRYNNLLWTSQSRGEVTIMTPSDEILVLQLQCPLYTVVRKIQIDGPFLRIEDTFKNLGKEDLGIIFKNEFIGEKSSKIWRICGVENSTASSDCGANPTIYIQQKMSGLGLAVKDSLLRNQMECTGSAWSCCMTDQQFGLASGEIHTFQWQIYLGEADYFDFLNALRRDWKVNHTIPGQWSFLDVRNSKAMINDPKLLKAWLDRYNINIFSLVPWFEYYHHPKYWQPRDVYKRMMSENQEKLKKVQPNTQCLASIESCLYYVPLSMFEGTLTLKKQENGKRGDFNTVLSEAATKVIDKTPWADSVMRNKDGRVIVDCRYAQNYEETGVNLKLFPTRANHWQKVFLNMMKYLLVDCELDGVYIDCFSLFNNWSLPDRWDGVSVKIDPATGKITDKFTNLAVLTEEARHDWIQFCVDHGKTAYVNGNPVTAMLQDMPMVCFMEAEYSFEPFAPGRPDAPYAARGQLSTPLVLGPRPSRYGEEGTKRYAEVIHKAVIAFLRYGELMCHYYTAFPEKGQPGYGESGVMNYMFPFTPVELHEGLVIGKERIITCVSRTFHWPESAKPQCKHFNNIGVELNDGFTLEQNKNGGWDVTVSLKDWQETAVIMTVK